jgi:beta-glucosidase
VDEDISLLKELGIRHYRMGLDWARIEPQEGVFDPSALEHYRDELAALRACGIAPLVTLHHFNNPWWLEERGGWVRHDAIAAYLTYVRHVVSQLKDLVDEWVTINEPNVYATQSYVFGDWPPGHRKVAEAMTVMSHMAQAHIRAYQVIHALQPGARVGVAHHLRVFDPANMYNPLDVVGAKTMEFLFQGAVLDATAYGRFRLPLRGSPSVSGGRYYDFTGVNYYTRSWVTAVSEGTRPNSPVNDLGWEIYPEGMTRVLQMVAKKYPGPIYITENGTPDGVDAFRPRYLFDHLKAVMDSDVDVERYYHWCFTDNWEWIEGEEPRFGLVHLDYETQKRTLKESAHLYADMIANGGVTGKAYARWVEPAAQASVKR